jgi:splicing factor 1
MSWRNQGITGSNNIPLGNRRRFGGDGNGDSQYESSKNSPYDGDSGKRGRSPTRGASLNTRHTIQANFDSAEPAADGEKRRRKRNRWGDAAENKAAGLMGLPTMIQANMTAEQLEAYTLHLRIEEISQKLRINDVVPAEADR